MNARSRRSILESLRRLELLARSYLQLCRVIAAHTEEMWKAPARTVARFETESARMRKLADKIESHWGAEFHRWMPARMRDIADGLAAERAREIPLRRQIEAGEGLVDYVLCGFAAEGHRLGKRLHTGATFAFQDRHVRATGIGPDEGFSYHLRCLRQKPLRFVVTLANDGRPRPGVVRIGDAKFPLDDASFEGLREKEFTLAGQTSASLSVQFWSTTPQPLWVSAIQMTQ